MINIHPIQQLILDLQFIGIKESNNYVFDKASNLSNNKITSALSTFFDDPRFETLHYEFNNIELDLGVIPYENFEDKFIEKLIEAIKLKFKDLLENTNNDNNYVLKDTVQNYYEIIKYYLLNGRLPWWSTKFHNTNIKSILEDFILKYSDQFKNLLFEIGGNENVRKRIAYSFSENLIKKTIILLQPNEFEYFFSYHDYIININNNQKIINESESNLSKAIWYNILSYILTETSSVFEKKEFLKRNLITISSFYNIEFKKLLELIYKATINIAPTNNSEIYRFAKDIQNIYVDITKSNPATIIDNFEHFDNSGKEENFKQNNFKDTISESLYILHYYLSYGSLPNGYQNLNILDLKNIFQNIFKAEQILVDTLLLNISNTRGIGNRLFDILNTTNYKYAIDLILKRSLNYSINDIHNSFIQLLISQNRSTNIYLSDEWKKLLLTLVYINKYNITFQNIFSLYLNKYATVHNIDIYSACEIYYKDLLLQNNKYLISILLEKKNEIVQNFNINDFEKYANEGLIDLLKFIIDNGFIPWWGIKFIKNNFKSSLDDLISNDFNDIINLLKFSNKNNRTQNRFVNLIGVNNTLEILLQYISQDPNIEIYKLLQTQYFNFPINGLYLNNNKIFISILWNTLSEHNFQRFEPIYFVKKYIYYVNSLNNLPVDYLIDQININITSATDNPFKKFILNILSDIKNNTFDNNLYLINKNRFQEILLANFKIDKYDNILFEQYIKLISDNDSYNQLSIINNVTNTLDQLFSADILPPKYNTLGDIDIENLIIRLIEYLYDLDKIALNKFLDKFNNYLSVYKLFITEWIYTNKNEPIAKYITKSIFTNNISNYNYLENNSFEKTNLLLNYNIYNEKFIVEVHRKINIDSTISTNLIFDKYQETLNSYLKNGIIIGSNENNDQLLKYLIINIYKNKGSKILLDLFNNSEANDIYKNYLLSLFTIANNIQDRQIYNSMLRSYYYFEINDTLFDSNDDINNYDYDDHLIIDNILDNTYDKNIDERISLYDLIIKSLGLNYINNSQFIDELTKILSLFLQFNIRPTILEHLKNSEFDYYFKLLIIEIVKNSPTNFYNLLLKNNNQNSIIYIHQLFMYANNGIELTIKNILIDYFRNYINNNLNKAINPYPDNQDDIVFNITSSEISNIIIDLNKSNKIKDIYFLFYAHHNNINVNIYNLIKIQTKQDDIFENTILDMYINILLNGPTNKDQTDNLNNIINKTIILSLNKDIKFNANVNFIDKLLQEVISNNITKEILEPLITYLDNLTITQPLQLVQLIDQTILKSKRILNNELNKIEQNETLGEKNIRNVVNQIKDQQNNRIIDDQIKIFNDQQSEQNNKDEEILKNESIYINNVGLVLFHLFIPAFFNQLNLLNEDGDFVNIDCKYRAVHLLQLLVSDASYDEHELVLNKILCNLEISDSIPMDIEFTDKEKALCQELMGVVLQRWEKMSNSSIGHFRAAFLMRDGRLKYKPDGWYLNVEKRGYDVILSSIPWAFGVVKFKWMHKFLYTEWT